MFHPFISSTDLEVLGCLVSESISCFCFIAFACMLCIMHSISLLLLCVTFSHTAVVSALSISWLALLLHSQCTFTSSSILNLISSIDHIICFSLLGLLVEMFVVLITWNSYYCQIFMYSYSNCISALHPNVKCTFEWTIVVLIT